LAKDVAPPAASFAEAAASPAASFADEKNLFVFALVIFFSATVLDDMNAECNGRKAPLDIMITGFLVDENMFLHHDKIWENIRFYVLRYEIALNFYLLLDIIYLVCAI